ncbi:hypothetical protein H6F50_23830 [Coleofasciculus sp. FACHB-712]|uniref:hypothetical protein n=1 Tax=Coleofasciculus sp. FACHB-712 TaxID=2692789 RepID=UPI0016873F02|nr:hypothetical protein [Coleofasciculus sp. FACHB-712]MBD1945339.1 hypothetical protein [Coleofasciculus sp. FACHB-712]
MVVAIGEREVRDSLSETPRDRLDNPEDFERIQQTVEMFKDVLPEIIVQDALFHRGLANLKPVTKL